MRAAGKWLGFALAAALLVAVPSIPPAQAQTSGGGPEGAGKGGGAPDPDPAMGREALEKAYKREFAFLEAQKRSLQERLAQFQDRAAGEKQALEQEVQRLKDEAVRLKTRMETLREQVKTAEEQLQSNKNSRQILEATFTQAGVTLKDFGFPVGKGSEFRQLDDERRKVERLFSMGNAVLDRTSGIRRESGSFFLADGTKVDGTLLKVGRVASYGLSDEASGALAPAGGGALKLWKKPAAGVAEGLANGDAPEQLKIFLYESLDQEVATPDSDTVLSTIRKGGAIGWIIVAMGAFAGLLALLRAGFLQWASASTGRIIDRVGALVSRGEVEEAQALCERKRGAAWKVVGAAVRNLNRDREHLEDIISESILRESTRLDRFGPLILVIAAVAPLLGLLGTVTGMISTFEVITEHGTGDPKLLSGGISVALVTTELGLIVAVPTLLAGNLLSGWAERIKNDMEKTALRITNLYAGRA
ncbi:MotA/TolQ/ExbB proton channel family protein [Thiohalorhabdus sp. Cl-TMA]|uniref:MotA/TolQ/ExbB proton channel family protein n=1 Tax=Thiohalorhabdus methylotrophus TaxID=3242694 RepID=A0ABV4TTR0_9GAMM